jgi:uncharacterized protein
VSRQLRFRRHRQPLAVCRLNPKEAVHEWARAGGFSAVVRTPDELSVVCAEAAVPEGIQAQPGWAAIELIGPFDFALTGVLAAALVPLAESGTPVFAISTYDTDWILIPAEQIEKAVRALTAAGHNEI